MMTSYISISVLHASHKQEIVDQSFPNTRLSAIQVVIYCYRRLPGIPCYCSSEHKSAVVLWYSYTATRYRTTSRYVSEERNEERTKISGERGGLGQEEGEKRSVSERHRRSEGGLSVLFARRAVIEYRYSQSHGACRRADAKINEPITEVDSRLLCLCVRHASAAYMCAAC